MNNIEKMNELSEELLSKISGGELNEYDMITLDKMVPMYRKLFPDMSLEQFLTNTFRYSDPRGIEPRSEEEIAEIRDYIAHYWE